MLILCISYCVICSVVKTASEVSVHSSKSNISCCACFCQDRINIVDNGPSGAVFWFHNDDSVGSTQMFQLLSSTACTEPRSFPFLVLCCQQGGWMCPRSWEGTEPGQIIPSHQTVTPSSAGRL